MARILLVDDEEYIRRLYTEELSEEGHKVFTVASGHNLLKRIDSLQPEAVVLDISIMTCRSSYVLLTIHTNMI
jgi:DNA-binding response OmpR family regulator